MLTLARLATLLFALIMVAAAPLRTEKYDYKVAKRAEIVRRGTQTRPHQRRASPIPPSRYAVFANYYFGGTSTATNSETTQPTFGACAALCTATSDCEFFRWVRMGSGSCDLRKGTFGGGSDNGYRSALKGLTCAQAKARYAVLASATCVEEFY